MPKYQYDICIYICDYYHFLCSWSYRSRISMLFLPKSSGFLAGWFLHQLFSSAKLNHRSCTAASCCCALLHCNRKATMREFQGNPISKPAEFRGNAEAHTGNPSIQESGAEMGRLWVLDQPRLFIKVHSPFLFKKKGKKKNFSTNIVYRDWSDSSVCKMLVSMRMWIQSSRIHTHNVDRDSMHFSSQAWGGRSRQIAFAHWSNKSVYLPPRESITKS